MDTDNTTEAGLIRRWRMGDRAAGDLLLRRYRPMLQAFFQRKLAHNVDELVQRTLLACVQSVDRFEGRASFKSYLFGIARNQFLMSLRSDRAAPYGAANLSTWPEDSPSQLLAFKQERRILLGALIQVAPEFRNVLKKFYWDGATVEEIGRALNLPIGTVKSRLSRGRAMLKERVMNMNISTTRSDELLRVVEEWSPDDERSADAERSS